MYADEEHFSNPESTESPDATSGRSRPASPKGAKSPLARSAGASPRRVPSPGTVASWRSAPKGLDQLLDEEINLDPLDKQVEELVSRGVTADMLTQQVERIMREKEREGIEIPPPAAGHGRGILRGGMEAVTRRPGRRYVEQKEWEQMLRQLIESPGVMDKLTDKVAQKTLLTQEMTLGRIKAPTDFPARRVVRNLDRTDNTLYAHHWTMSLKKKFSGDPKQDKYGAPTVDQFLNRMNQNQHYFPISEEEFRNHLHQFTEGLAWDKIHGWLLLKYGLQEIYNKLLALYDRREGHSCLLYTSPSPRDRQKSRMPSSA